MTGVWTDRLDRILFIFYLIFVVSSTFSRALSSIALGIAFLCFLVIVIATRYNPFVRSIRWFYVFAGLYLVWLLLAAVVSKNPGVSLYACRREWLFVAVPIGLYLFQNENWKSKTIRWFAIGVGILAAYACAEYITGTDLVHFENGSWSPIHIDQISGTYFRPLTFAGFYSVAALFLLTLAITQTGAWSRKRTAFAVVAALALAAVALTLSRGPVICAGLGLVLLGFIGRRTVQWSTAALLIALVVLSISQPGMYERYRKVYEIESVGRYEGSRHFIWKNSLEIVGRNPMFGVGNGNFWDEYHTQVGPSVALEHVHGQAHNDLINSAAIGGIPCGLLFAGLWVAAFWYLAKGARRRDFTEADRQICLAALVAAVVFFANSMTDSTFAAEETHELIMFIWALGLAPWYKQKSGRNMELRA